MNYIFIILRKPYPNTSDAPEYMMSYAISDLETLKNHASKWAKIEQCSESDIQVVELHIPEEQYNAKRHKLGTYVSMQTKNLILQENEKHSPKFIAPCLSNDTQKMTESFACFFNHAKNLASTETSQRRFAPNKPLSTSLK